MDERTRRRAYRTEIDPTPEQTQQFLQHCGATRYIYNWGLTRRIEHYEATKKTLGYAAQSKELTQLKQEIPWLYDVSNAALQNALRNLDRAYTNFFRRLKQQVRRKGFPRYKTKRRGVGSFKVERGVTVEAGRIKLPRIGWIVLKEKGYIPMDWGHESVPRMTSTTISEEAGHWYVSVQTEEYYPVGHEGPVMAVHLGVRQWATALSVDGEEVRFENPKALLRHGRKLARAQRALARKKKGSTNRAKARAEVARIHRHIRNIRREATHRASHAITKQAGTLVIEDWDVAGMLEEKIISQRLADAAMSEFRRQILYKADWQGVRLVVVERGFPSSKRCARCGHVKDTFSPSAILYRCAECGWEAEREHNACLNLLSVAGKASETLNAPGEAGLYGRETDRKPVSSKGEPDVRVRLAS